MVVGPRGNHAFCIMAGVLLGVAAWPASAIGLSCSDLRTVAISERVERPQPPACVEEPVLTQERSGFAFCHLAVEAYQRRMRDYLQCLGQESFEAADEHNRIIKRFNCQARGEAC
jgi:hypothetical protein